MYLHLAPKPTMYTCFWQSRNDVDVAKIHINYRYNAVPLRVISISWALAAVKLCYAVIDVCTCC